MPRIPKDERLRQRRNRTATRATLPTREEAASRHRVPPLPPRRPVPWLPQVRAWWTSVWRSPMAAEYGETDRIGLLLLADLFQHAWTPGIEPRALVMLSAEIRLQSDQFGLSPISRRRLQWSIPDEDDGDQVKRRTPRQPTRAVKDPRKVLRAMP